MNDSERTWRIPTGDAHGGDVARFEVFASHNGFRFRLVQQGGALLLFSGDYVIPEAAMRDVERLREAEVQFSPCMSPIGLFYFTCTASTGEFLATSPMYARPNERDAAQALAARLVVLELDVLRGVPR
jgi:hypothetical protein